MLHMLQEFDGYWNLMNHRKIVHPSSKSCRNFPDGKCHFGLECWYVHEEQLMDVDESFNSDSLEKNSFKCYICGNNFGSKADFMKHKKEMHGANVKVCEKYLKDGCPRGFDECWYKHTSAKEKTSEDNQKPSEHNQKPSEHNQKPFEKNQKPSEKKQQGFQEASENIFPPDNHMKKMMEVMNKLCMKVETMERKLEELIM